MLCKSTAATTSRTHADSPPDLTADKFPVCKSPSIGATPPQRVCGVAPSTNPSPPTDIPQSCPSASLGRSAQKGCAGGRIARAACGGARLKGCQRLAIRALCCSAARITRASSNPQQSMRPGRIPGASNAAALRGSPVHAKPYACTYANCTAFTVTYGTLSA